ncbi:hypothetical protein MHYP_G00112060 [Metynnis hypsauchen]
MNLSTDPMVKFFLLYVKHFAADIAPIVCPVLSERTFIYVCDILSPAVYKVSGLKPQPPFCLLSESSGAAVTMLRVSSYRKLFEEEQWSQTATVSQRCGAQLLRSSGRGGVLLMEPDFAAARALNREGVVQFARERSIIATLNDRLASLIDVLHVLCVCEARCLEEENESLEAQIIELEKRLGARPSSSTSLSDSRPTDSSLEAVIERLRRDKEKILCDTEELKTELRTVQTKYDKVVEERSLIQLEREDVAVEVDEVTVECLALGEQVAIYEEQLAEMERQQELRLENLSELQTGDKGAPTVALQFPSIDITPAIMDIKEYYCQLAESIQFESRASTLADITARGEEKGKQLEKLTGGEITDVSKVTDVKVLKDLIAELQMEVAKLEKYGEELEAEIEAKREAHFLKIEELEACICQLEEEEADLQGQIKEQTEDYEELLNEKMALDIEIAAYR